MNKSYEEWKKARRNRIVTMVLGAVLLAALAVMFVIGLQGGSALVASGVALIAGTNMIMSKLFPEQKESEEEEE
jgi:predicted phage tail protein